MSAIYTPGPWEWQKFGDEYCLAAQQRSRPIVLSVTKKFGLTSLNRERGTLEPLDPLHPDARIIAASVETYEAAKKLFGYIGDGTLVRDISKDNDSDWVTRMARFVSDLALAEKAIGKAEGR